MVGAAATVSRRSVAGSNNSSRVWSPHSDRHHHPTILLVLASGKHHYGLNEHLPTPPLEQLHDWFTKDKGHIQYINSITNKELLSSSHQSIMPEPETGIRHARKVSSLSSKELLIWCFVWHKITISYPQARTFLLRRYNARGNRDKATIQIEDITSILLLWLGNIVSWVVQEWIYFIVVYSNISSSPFTIEQIVHMLEKRWSVSSLRTFTQPSVSLLNTLGKKLGKEAMKIDRTA